MIHYGDITKISGYDVPIVDCVVGGSPCQELSVAGKRAGLDGERSGLFMEQIRVTKEMRDYDERCNRRSGEHIRPRFFIWENVPGAFSSNRGEDFRIVLEEVAKIVQKDAVIPMPPKNKWTTSGAIVGDGWSIAWRILDAQFWGVPQRRRRITLIADFGGGCAQEILFERSCLSRNPAESRTEREGAPEDAQGCVGVYDREGKDIGVDIYNTTLTGDVVCSLTSGGYGSTGTSPKLMVVDQGGGKSGANVTEGITPTLTCTHDGEPVVCYDIGDRRKVASESVDVSPTLLEKMGTGGNNVPVIVEGVDCYNQTTTGDKSKALTSAATDSDHIPCIVMDRASYNQGENALFNIGIDENGVAFSHIAKGPGAVCYIDTSHADDVVRTDDVVAPLQARDYKGGKLIAMATANKIYPIPDDVRAFVEDNNSDAPHQQDLLQTSDDVARAICCGTHAAGSHLTKTIINYGTHYVIRRLTPLECERLQGYPDRWTDIGEYIDSKGKKKKSSDSARYKALGNSIALPPWKWVIKRLCSHYERDATLASLFDGIGGFPLLWEQINGKGSCLWASEIEDFPIAVTKARIE